MILKKNLKLVLIFILILKFIGIRHGGQAQPHREKEKFRIPVTMPCLPDSTPVWYQIPASADKSNLSSEKGVRDEIISYAMNFLGIRYRSSGKSPKIGFDCSGFTGYIFRNFGMRLKASSPAQAMEGKKVPLSQAREGDLAFFGRKGRKGKILVNHAAIVISRPGEPLAIIHSASNKGIVITRVNESRYWRNSLLFVKNVLSKNS
jgi:cell wall-associated NlpC family hydrolase